VAQAATLDTDPASTAAFLLARNRHLQTQL